MVMDMFNQSFNNLLTILSPDLTENLEWLITVMKALGVLAVVYVLYLITMITINIRKVRQIGRIKKRVELIDSKLDLLMEKNKVKVPKNLKIKKLAPSFFDKIVERLSK